MTDAMTKERPKAENSKPRKAAPMTEKPGMNRIHISYPNSMKKRLEEIKAENDKGSVSEVIREAIKFYILAYEEHKKGSDFLIRLENGEKERLRMFV